MQNQPGLFHYIDRWLPKRLRGVEDPWQALQARVLLVLLLLFVVPIVPLVVGLFVASILGAVNLWVFTVAAMAAMVGVISCFYYFQKTGNLYASSVMYAVLALLMVVLVIFFTGGWESPVALYLLTLPVLVSLIVDKKTSALFALLVFLSYTFLFVLHQSNYHFYQLIPKEYLTYTRASLWFVTLVSIFISFFLYDFSEKSLRVAIDQDRALLEHDAHQDYQTGLLNEQGLYEYIGQSGETIDQATREKGIIFLEVKNISGIISHFGYEIGDLFLDKVIGFLREVIADHAILVRYTNQEFIIYTDWSTGEGGVFNRIINRFENSQKEAVVLENGYRFLLDMKIGSIISRAGDLSVPEMLEKIRFDMSKDYNDNGFG